MKPTERINGRRHVENDAKPVANDSAGILELLKRAAEASLIFGALLFVIGWSYVDAYYGAFGLRMSQLSISNQEVVISSFHFIFASVLTVASFILGIVVAVTLIGHFSKTTGVRHDLVVAVTLVVLLAFAGILANRAAAQGREAALRDTLTSTTTLPRVEVEVDEAKAGTHILDRKELESKAYRLLLQTDSRVWLFKSVEDANGYFTVVTLAKEAILAIRMERPKGGIQ